MRKDDFHVILDRLYDVDSDNIGSVHSFFRELPESYSMDEGDLDYLSERGLDGLENLENISQQLAYMKEERFHNFVFFGNRYEGFREELEYAVMDRSSRLMYEEDTSLSKSDSCKVAAFLVEMGLGEKVNSGLYRLNAEPEDYDIVDHVLEKI